MKPRSRQIHAFSLLEMLIAMVVFAIASLGIWSCISTTFFLTAKNTGLNLSHTALQQPLDALAGQINSSLQVLDVATFDGTTFTHIDETTASGASMSGNAVRFLRVLPISLFMNPDDGAKSSDGKAYSQTNPQNPFSITYPDYLTAGNKSVSVTFTSQTANLAEPDFKKDLINARLFPRFPYLTETVTTGPCPGTIPGLDLSSTPALTASPETLKLANGLPSAAKTVPSCNQAYLVIVSAAAILNRGSYSELIYYPDAFDLTRANSLSRALGPSTSGAGPTAFALLKTAGSLNDPTARGSLCITLPVYAPDLSNSVMRRGGAAALTNVTLTLPVEVRRRAQF